MSLQTVSIEARDVNNNRTLRSTRPRLHLTHLYGPYFLAYIWRRVPSVNYRESYSLVTWQDKSGMEGGNAAFASVVIAVIWHIIE